MDDKTLTANSFYWVFNVEDNITAASAYNKQNIIVYWCECYIIIIMVIGRFRSEQAFLVNEGWSD